jgi:hypothetical protein
MDEITHERWRELRIQRPFHGIHAEPVSAGSDFARVGVDSDGRLYLLVAVPAEPRSLPADLQSLTVRVLENEGVWLAVSAPSHHEELLTLIVNRVLRAIGEEGREPGKAVTATIEDLRAALKPVSPDLGVSEQIGLFGELWVLSNVLIPTIGARAAFLWSGPEGERHDFVGQWVHIEVKTTTRSEPRHDISRLDQLRSPPGKHLLLVSVQLERSLAGEETLADRIDALVAQLGDQGRAIDAFETKLRTLGWHDGLRQDGSLLRFTLRDVQVFAVAGAFPRLPDDYVAPPGVSSIRYTIDVGAVPALGVDQVVALLETM